MKKQEFKKKKKKRGKFNKTLGYQKRKNKKLKTYLKNNERELP